ncbi:hypothetical protein D917_06914 [Trichinella nativa]|uniref:Uncharacterized protein n=1 Tax=Trichinella nativa TaxID=6335 RepID=A0A1Y3EUE2_9BILA|nr:hypothetical protein D917_06914 [Trichinella nativa]
MRHETIGRTNLKLISCKLITNICEESRMELVLGLYGRCPCHLDISCRLESGNHEIVNVVRDAQLTAAGQRSQCEPGNLVVDRLRYRILHVLQAVVGQLKQHARIIRLTGSIQRTSSFPSQ